MRKMLLASLLFSTGFLGCSFWTKPVVIHPIEGTDIVTVKQGATITAPKDGAFLSTEYIQEVMDARLKK